MGCEALVLNYLLCYIITYVIMMTLQPFGNIQVSYILSSIFLFSLKRIFWIAFFVCLKKTEGAKEILLSHLPREGRVRGLQGFYLLWYVTKSRYIYIYIYIYIHMSTDFFFGVVYISTVEWYDDIVLLWVMSNCSCKSHTS